MWIKLISQKRNAYSPLLYEKDIQLIFSENLRAEDFEPIHLVTLACLIQFFDSNGHQVWLGQGNASVDDMLFNQLRFHEYWRGGKHHVDAMDGNIFNLWRIVESQKDLYAKNVELYFQNNFFRGKDLSAVSLSMVEAFYNVFDHAMAGGNAFSFIKYEKDKGKLLVAICDFGIGIAKSVRDFDSSISNDKDALLKSIEIDFTVRSKLHNRGQGLYNILSCSDVIRIISNNALLLKNDKIRAMETDFHFGGTLIYLEIDLSKTEDAEILEEFNLW